MEKETKHVNVYDMVTDIIIKKLEEGIVPWKQPWTSAGVPINAITNKRYTGINVWLLASLGYNRNLFLTFKQVQELGGSVIKGSKSSPVIFWKQEITEDLETHQEKKKHILRYYSVFNIEQCEGLPKEYEDAIKQESKPIKVCNDIFIDMPNPPKLIYKNPEAYYSVEYDTINMPPSRMFETSEDYYGTLFHELVHSTGHEKRLNRSEITGTIIFASYAYSIEELVAEIGACYLKSLTGIQTKYENNISYINHWLTIFKNDKRLIIHASAKAQRAVDYILNEVPS